MKTKIDNIIKWGRKSPLEKQSRAGKKGWDTRRRNIRLKEVQAIQDVDEWLKKDFGKKRKDEDNH